jgi:hypothetical protein
MMAHFKTALVALFVMVLSASGAGLLDVLKSKTAAESAPSLSALSQEQMVNGLKEALGNGVQQAIASLGKKDGFLADVGVKIPMPESLQKIEKGLRAVGQNKYADEFVATMNRAAEQAVPEAAAVLVESLKQMSIADARSVLTGGDNAATNYFRRTSATAIRQRFLPIVKTATEKAGVTSAYKQMAAKAAGAGKLGGGGALGDFGAMAGNALGGKMPDLDSYVTDKALDGLFFRVGEQERLIRANPGARTTDLLKQVFGSLAK